MMYETLLEIFSFAKQIQVDWLFPVWIPILSSLVMIYLVHCLSYRMNGGTATLWQGFWDGVRLNLPSGYQMRIELLKKIFPDWKTCLKFEYSGYFAGGWQSLDFARALKENDTKTLKEITKIFGSPWSFWLFTPITCFVLCLLAPTLLFVVSFLLLASGIIKTIIYLFPINVNK